MTLPSQPRPRPGERLRVAVLSTGGTIEKTYNESDGRLENQRSVLELMLASLVLNGVTVDRIPVMNKDSLEMNAADHARICEEAKRAAESHDAIVITHGTDRLAETGEALVQTLGADAGGIVIALTGAMRPYELRNTDAVQNLVEALLAVQLLPPGVYCVMHNQALAFPGVVKDRTRGTFVRAGRS